jgi:hypothetical protein
LGKFNTGRRQPSEAKAGSLGETTIDFQRAPRTAKLELKKHYILTTLNCCKILLSDELTLKI